MKEEYLVILCTVPDEETALKISRALVDEKLSACCNIVPGLRSIYFWQGKICDDSEMLLIIKSRQDVCPTLQKKIRELHPYEIPEIIALPIRMGSLDYLKWMDENVRQE